MGSKRIFCGLSLTLALVLCLCNLASAGTVKNQIKSRNSTVLHKGTGSSNGVHGNVTTVRPNKHHKLKQTTAAAVKVTTTTTTTTTSAPPATSTTAATTSSTLKSEVDSKLAMELDLDGRSAYINNQYVAEEDTTTNQEKQHESQQQTYQQQEQEQQQSYNQQEQQQQTYNQQQQPYNPQVQQQYNQQQQQQQPYSQQQQDHKQQQQQYNQQPQQQQQYSQLQQPLDLANTPLYELMQQQMASVLSNVAEAAVSEYTPQIKEITESNNESNTNNPPKQPAFSYTMNQFSDYDDDNPAQQNNTDDEEDDGAGGEEDDSNAELDEETPENCEDTEESLLEPGDVVADYAMQPAANNNNIKLDYSQSAYSGQKQQQNVGIIGATAGVTAALPTTSISNRPSKFPMNTYGQANLDNKPKQTLPAQSFSSSLNNNRPTSNANDAIKPLINYGTMQTAQQQQQPQQHQPQQHQPQKQYQPQLQLLSQQHSQAKPQQQQLPPQQLYQMTSSNNVYSYSQTAKPAAQTQPSNQYGQQKPQQNLDFQESSYDYVQNNVKPIQNSVSPTSKPHSQHHQHHNKLTQNSKPFSAATSTTLQNMLNQAMETTSASSNSSPFSSIKEAETETVEGHKRKLTFRTVASHTQFITTPLADLMLKFSIGMAKPHRKPLVSNEAQIYDINSIDTSKINSKKISFNQK